MPGVSCRLRRVFDVHRIASASATRAVDFHLIPERLTTRRRVGEINAIPFEVTYVCIVANLLPFAGSYDEPAPGIGCAGPVQRDIYQPRICVKINKVSVS